MPRCPKGERAGDQGEAASDLNQLLGVEGAASRAYMQGLRQLVDDEWGFAGRATAIPPPSATASTSWRPGQAVSHHRADLRRALHHRPARTVEERADYWIVH
jgi:CRISPR associated protein Cas1